MNREKCLDCGKYFTVPELGIIPVLCSKCEAWRKEMYEREKERRGKG